ncbi:MAG: hypothetical protein PHF84_06500 [bacterium]|nr:hypothetical protein [bacterium]
MKRRFLFVCVVLLGVTAFLPAENIFNRYSIMSPLGLASGGFMSAVYNDSYNLYNCPSLIGIRDYSYHEVSYFRDTFGNILFQLSTVSEKKELAPYNAGLKIYYNDFSDETMTCRNYGINPALSVRIMEKLLAGISFLIYKNSLAGTSNLLFLSSFSVNYSVMKDGLAGLYVKNIGSDLTYFGKYSDTFYPDLGLFYNHMFPFDLQAQAVFNYSSYNEFESSLSFLYHFILPVMEIIPVLGFHYSREQEFLDSLSFGLSLQFKPLQTEFGFKTVDSESIYSVSIKSISF